MKILNKRETKQFAANHSSVIRFDGLIKNKIKDILMKFVRL